MLKEVKKHEKIKKTMYEQIPMKKPKRNATAEKCCN